MRKLALLALIAVAAPLVPLNAASAAGLPRYSSIPDASASSFTVSFRNLEKTEYVTCTLPAPVSCGNPSATAGDNGGAIGGIRNEAGNLQVVATPDARGGATLVSHAFLRGSWQKVREWAVPALVSRVMVANNGTRFLTFSADGSVILYDTASSTPVGRSTIGPTGSALTLSSTGRYLAWYKPATLNGTGQRCYFVADTTTGTTAQTCDTVAYWDLVSEDNRVFSFAPDDSALLFRSDRDGYQSLYRIALGKGLPATLTPERLILRPYQVADMAYIDANRVAVVANRANATSWGLWSFDPAKQTMSLIADSASYGVPLKRFANYVSFARTGPNGVTATLYNVNSGSVTGADQLAQTTVPAGTAVTAPATQATLADGSRYALWTPSSVKKTTPIVIWLHGGPYRQISTAGYHPFSSYGSFDWMLEQVRLSGAIVAKLDYPGSYGYGRAYAESLTGNVGAKDVAAVRGLISALRSKYGSSAPIYLVGNSYGGYLANKALVEMPSSVAGIYAISGVSGWEELVAANPNTIFSAQFKNAVAGLQDPLFAKAEVLLKADKIGSQKILLAHGDRDTSVSMSQTTTWEQVLKVAKKNVQATIYAGEDHVFTKPANIADLCKKAIGLVGGNANGRCQL